MDVLGPAIMGLVIGGAVMVFAGVVHFLCRWLWRRLWPAPPDDSDPPAD